MEVKEPILTHVPLAKNTWIDNPKIGIPAEWRKSNIS